jgi:copper chaperone
MSQFTFKVEGMSCEHCQRAVTEALEGVNGVRHAEVDLAGGRATITVEGSSVDSLRLRDAVAEAGYTLVER